MNGLIEGLIGKWEALSLHAVKFSDTLIGNDWYMVMAILMAMILMGKLGMRN